MLITHTRKGELRFVMRGALRVNRKYSDRGAIFYAAEKQDSRLHIAETRDLVFPSRKRLAGDYELKGDLHFN